MAVILFRRPTVLAVHPKAWIRPPGNVEFRVTQDFDDADPIHPGNPHMAVDLGNARCGDAVVAMAPGTVSIRNDTSGALGVILDHGYGVTSEYWHLATRTVIPGTIVSAGRAIGTVGRTGIDIGGCHLHNELKRNGIRIDPEPLIMGGWLWIDDGDDMATVPKGLQAIAIGEAQGNFRITPWSTAGSLAISSPVRVQAFGENVRGEPYTVNGLTGDEYAWIGYKGSAYYVARPKLTNVKLQT